MPVPAGGGDTYASLDELKERMDIADTVDDSRLTDALDAASREIDTWCEREFTRDDAVSARLFQPLTPTRVLVDDIHSTDGLTIEVDTSGDGSYATAWTAADYQLEPVNGRANGLSGWPYTRIVAVGSRCFPVCSARPPVRVTALWGWSAAPAAVRQACLIIAAESFKLGDAPFGVAGFGEFGSVRVRMNSRAQSLLAPYRRNPVLVG
ncbi:MAG TPA: phage head-tail connector protein [Pseudonocardia sp.]